MQKRKFDDVTLQYSIEVDLKKIEIAANINISQEQLN